MSRKVRLLLLILLTLFLNLIIYWRALLTIEDADLVFAECARNSGRTSAAINLVLLFGIGYWGLGKIYSQNHTRFLLRTLFTLFAINHLIHFLFVSQNFEHQFLELDISHNIHGFVTFLCLLIVPVLLWSFRTLSKILHYALILHLINVTYFISDTFYGRVNEEDPAYLHRIGVLIMIGAVIYMIYRMFKERNISYHSLEK